MSHYLDDPEMTAETIVDGWLMTGDLGRIDASGPPAALRAQEEHDRHRRREKYLSRRISKTSFEGLPVKEFCVFAANYLWPARTMVGEQLVIVLHPKQGKPIDARTRREIGERNRRLLNYKRISGYLVWDARLPAHRVAENQARRTRRTDSRTARPRSGGAAVIRAAPSSAEDCTVNARFFAIVNPAAGGGRCGKLAAAALDRVRQAAASISKLRRRRGAGRSNATSPASAYAHGLRNFLAVGGDGTSYEIVNGLFPEAQTEGRPALGFLPLGTGNSFLRDFTTRGVEHTIEALQQRKRRACDVIRLRHHAAATSISSIC